MFVRDGRGEENIHEGRDGLREESIQEDRDRRREEGIGEGRVNMERRSYSVEEGRD
jgi:hypothetical protein